MKKKTARGSKKGMTLIEAIMAIGLFTLGVEGFTLLFLRTWEHNKYTIEMGQSSMVVSQGVSKVANYLRGARQSDSGSYPIASASANDLVVYSDFDKDDVTERLHFYKSGTQILMGVTDPTNTFPRTYPAGDQSTQVIASSIMNTASDPVFQYFNKDYPGDTTNNPLAAPVSVSEIRMVRIFLKINIDPNNAPDNIETETFVGLRNLNDYDRIQ